MIQTILRTEVRNTCGEVFDDQACGIHLTGLRILGIHTDITNVRVGQGDQLSSVARICNDFLITGQRRIEDHLATGFTGSTNTLTRKDRTICES